MVLPLIFASNQSIMQVSQQLIILLCLCVVGANAFGFLKKGFNKAKGVFNKVAPVVGKLNRIRQNPAEILTGGWKGEQEDDYDDEEMYSDDEEMYGDDDEMYGDEDGDYDDEDMMEEDEEPMPDSKFNVKSFYADGSVQDLEEGMEFMDCMLRIVKRGLRSARQELVCADEEG